MKPETQSILTLTEKSYDEYNAILPLIKQQLGDRTPVFESILVEELPLTTCRRAYRTAIMVACGENRVYRETEHQKPLEVKRNRKPVQKEAEK
jgi:hypothetical protein